MMREFQESSAPRQVTILLAHPLLHRHRHRLQGIVAVVSGGGDDFIHYLHASKDLAKDGVGSVQSAAVRDTDIELRAVIVGVPRAVAFAGHLRHADRAPFMRTIAGFGSEKVAVAAGARGVGMLKTMLPVVRRLS